MLSLTCRLEIIGSICVEFMSAATSNKEKREVVPRLRKHGVNLIALASMQGANAALPLIIFPYLLTVVGADSYAQLVLAEAISMFCLSVVIYSFEIDGVADVAGCDVRRDHVRISQILSGILAARLTLFATCLFVILLAGIALPETIFWLLLGWLLLPLSFAVQPNWLFQALEDNVAPAVAVFCSRSLAAVFVILGVHTAADCWRVPILVGVPYLLAGLFMVAWACYRFNLRLQLVGWREIGARLRHGHEIFAGNISVILYREFNVGLLGVAGVDGAGIAAYSLAEKITKGVQAVARPLTQVFFPHALLALRGKSEPDRDALRRLLRFVFPQWVALFGVVVVLGGAWLITRRYAGLIDFPHAAQIIGLVMLMLPAVFAGVASFMLGGAGLNHLNARRDFFHYILLVGAVNVPLCLGLASIVDSIGGAIAFVTAESLLVVLLIRRYRAKPLRRVCHA